jgi:1-acyl-sn-glycerol-3-phosphate acyltransferase
VYPVATDSGRHWARGRWAKHPGTIHIAVGPPIPPGGTREALLADIEAHWRRSEINGFQPVDNSVGQRVESTPEQRREAG